MNVSESIIATAEEILMSLQLLIKRMQIPNQEYACLRSALFLTIAEQFEASLILTRNNLASHATVHVRGMIEAYLSMTLITKNPARIDQIRFDYSKGEKKLYESLLTHGGSSVQNDESWKEKFKESKKRYDALIKKGLRPLQIADKFSQADALSLFPVYVLLCAFTHNDIGALTMRHMGETSMLYKAPDGDELVVTMLQTGLIVVMSAAYSVQNLGVFPKDLYESIFMDMNVQWEKFMKAFPAPTVPTH